MDSGGELNVYQSCDDADWIKPSDHLIVIIGFDSPNGVLDAVLSFQSLPGRPKVLILENGSARYPEGTNVSYLERNVGYCGAANLGIAIGLVNRCSAVTIANWDVRVKPESFVALQAAVKSCPPDLAVIGGIDLDGAGEVTTAGGANCSRWTGNDRWSKSVPLEPTNVLFCTGSLRNLHARHRRPDPRF